jgi:hypothetical protein
VVGQLVPKPQQDENAQFDNTQLFEHRRVGACKVGLFRLLVLLQVLFTVTYLRQGDIQLALLTMTVAGSPLNADNALNALSHTIGTVGSGKVHNAPP